jgi:hypothetical protein
MKRADLTDRGVTQTIGGVTRTNGTLALASESWGVGSATTGIAAGTYNVDLTFAIPVSEDEKDLVGAIFLQTSTSDLTLSIDETPLGQLFYRRHRTGVTLTGTWQVSTTKFSIPVGAVRSDRRPQPVVFHSIIGSAGSANGIANGENEPGSSARAPARAAAHLRPGRLRRDHRRGAAGHDATNFGPLAGASATTRPRTPSSTAPTMRADMERRYNTDIGGIHGYFCHDFAHENASATPSTWAPTAELRLLTTVHSGVTLTNPALEYVTETVFLAGQAA